MKYSFFSDKTLPKEGFQLDLLDFPPLMKPGSKKNGVINTKDKCYQGPSKESMASGSVEDVSLSDLPNSVQVQTDDGSQLTTSKEAKKEVLKKQCPGCFMEFEHVMCHLRKSKVCKGLIGYARVDDLRAEAKKAKQVKGKLLGGADSAGSDSSFEVKGYKNRGNDCFANASGTVLLKMTAFKALIERYPDNSLLQEFKKSQKKEDLISIRSLVKSPDAKINWKLQDQQDAAEFIDAVLQTLMESNDISENEIKEKFQVKYQKVCTSNYAAFQEHKDPPAESSFLNVPVKSTLDEAFNASNREDEGTFTEGSEIRSFKREYQRYPDVLMIQFSRWMNGNTKNEEQVEIPLNWNPFKIEGNYKLRSAIVHEGGSIRSGHYYALINQNGKYYCVNDTQLSELSSDQFSLTLRKAYLVFYEKTSDESCDDGTIDIQDTDHTPPPSPTALNELMRKLLDTLEVKKNQKRNTHCKFCDVDADRTSLIEHLQSSGKCQIFYLRKNRVSTSGSQGLRDVQALEFSCFACDDTKFIQLNRHLQKSDNCLKIYKEHFNVRTHKDVMTEMNKLKRRLKPSRGKTARFTENKKQQERKKAQISKIDGINNYNQAITFANRLTCVLCNANHLDSGAKELKEFEAKEKNIDLKQKDHLKREQKFWICNGCDAKTRGEKEEGTHTQTQVGPYTLGYKDFSGRRRLFFPIFGNSNNTTLDEDQINRTNRNKIISILVPTSVEALGLYNDSNFCQSDEYLLPRLSYSDATVTVDDLKKCYTILYTKYWTQKKFCQTVTAKSVNVEKRTLSIVKDRIDISSIHGSEDWENQNNQNMVHRFQQLGNVAIRISFFVKKSNIECYVTNKIVDGKIITVDYIGGENKEHKTKYWLHNGNQRINLSDEFASSNQEFDDNSRQSLSTFICSVFQRTTNFVQHIIKNQSSELKGDDYFFSSSFDAKGHSHINGVTWPLSLQDINKELHNSSYTGDAISKKIKIDFEHYLSRNLSSSSNPVVLKEELGLTKDEANDLSNLVKSYQIDLQKTDPPLPVLEYIWCNRESSNQNFDAAEKLKTWMKNQLQNLPEICKRSLSTQRWLTCMSEKVQIQKGTNCIDIKLPENMSLKFHHNTGLIQTIRKLKENETLRNLSDFLGLYYYSLSITSENMVLRKRNEIIECFTTSFHPFCLRALRGPVEVDLAYGNFQWRHFGPSLANSESLQDSEAEIVFASHSEITLSELFQSIDSRKGKIESSREVKFLNVSPNWRPLFNKIDKKDKSDNSFTLEGDCRKYYDLVHDHILRHRGRINGRNLLLVETAAYYNPMKKEEAEKHYTLYKANMEMIKGDDKYNHRSITDDKPLPQYILCQNKQVLELRKSKKILSYPIYDDEETYESKYSRVLLYYPLEPGVDLKDIEYLLGICVVLYASFKLFLSV